MKYIIKYFLKIFSKIFFIYTIGIISYLCLFRNDFASFLNYAGLKGAVELFCICVIIAIIYTIINKNGCFELKIKFRDTTEMDEYFAKRVKKAKKEVRSLLWQDDSKGIIPVVNNIDRNERQKKMDKAVELFCKKGYLYRELFTFSFSKRLDIMKERLKLGENYQCRYYDNFDLEINKRFPKLQFRIIDDKEVIFASRKYSWAICAIKDPELVKIMKEYFDLAWDNAIEISNSNPQIQLDTVNKISDKVLQYNERYKNS
jgi:hypothetical protein